MSAGKKPDDPAEVPPFLQAKPGQSKDSAPRPADKPVKAPEIPYFLRGGPAAPAPDKPTPRTGEAASKPAAPPDAGILRGYSSPPPHPRPTSPPAPPKPDVTPAFLKPGAQLPENEIPVHADLISSEEVQRKLDEMARASEKDRSAEVPLVHQVTAPAKPAEPTRSTVIDWESAPAIFDQMVTGIRRDRQVQQRETQDQQSKIDADWQHVLESMRELERKVQGHPNLIYFTISRDQRDISVKLVDHNDKRGYSLFTLSRRHPAGAHPSLNAVWLIEFPLREWHYYDAKEAMAELVLRIAGHLA